MGNKKTFILLLFLAITSTANQQPGQGPNRPATLTPSNVVTELSKLKINDPHLWSIKKNGKTSYILGTIHVGVGLKNFPQFVSNLIMDSKQIITEGDFVDSKMLAEAYLEKPYRTVILQRLMEMKGELTELENGTELLAHHYGFSKSQKIQLGKIGFTEQEINFLPKTQPLNYHLVWPEVTLGSLPLDFEIEALADFHSISHFTLDTEEIIESAEKYETPRSVIISISDSVAAADDVDLSSIEELASHTEKFPDYIDSLKPRYLELLNEYLDGRVFATWPEIAPEGTEGYGVIYRNFAWLPKIERLISQKPSFIAVGVAHLYGDMGLLKELTRRGYQVERTKIPSR